MISSIEQIWRYGTINGVPAAFCEVETNRDSNSLMQNTDDPYSCNGKPSGSLAKKLRVFLQRFQQTQSGNGVQEIS